MRSEEQARDRCSPERAALIANALGHEPRSAVEVDEGWDFAVVIVDDEWVFRFPRRAETARALETEVALLPRLAPALPVQVPRFEIVSADPPFAGYRLLRGTPLVDEDSDGVRAFLDALHRFDASGTPVPQPDWVAVYAAQADEFRRYVVPLLDRDEQRSAERLLGEVESLTGFDPVLTHSDVGPEHLLCRDGKLVAVIDWGDARVGDAALDYAWLLNGPFPGWDVDDGVRRRARIYHRLGPWYEAHYGVTTARPENVRRGLAGVRARL